jgi:isopentenyl diphosphate isomerase/L-lactate dehydrogenase-like FMN-dependent dehydrogenase
LPAGHAEAGLGAARCNADSPDSTCFLTLNDSNFPQLRGVALANYFSDPHFRARLAPPPEEDIAAAVRQWASVFGMTVTWDDLAWLRSLTSVPLIVKGIQHPDDAKRAIDAGVDAVYCPNHGGRQANAGIAQSISCPRSSARVATFRSGSTPTSIPEPM